MNINPNDSFDKYLGQFEPNIQTRLTTFYTMVKDAFPDAQFFFSYQMPTFKGKKNLIHFAAYTNHIGVYPGPQGIQALLDAFPTIKTSKGTWLIPHHLTFPNKELQVLCSWIRSQNQP
jgi:uncharacterized protein YdhG (YjbR/CyaY superfamily)